MLALALVLSLLIGIHDYLMGLLAPFKPQSKGLPWLYAFINFGFWAVLSPWLWRAHQRLKQVQVPKKYLLWVLAALGFAIIHELVTTSLFYGIKLIIEQKTFTDQQLLHRLNLMVVGTFSRVFEFVILVVVFTIYDHYRAYKDQQLKLAAIKGELFEIKLESLKAQLHPHFLFNTLNSISALITEDAAKSRSMIANLSYLLRALFKQDTEHLVTLEQELNYIKYYLRIEEARYSNRMQVTYNIDEQLNEVLVPKLILQPLVENAIKHGIAKCNSLGIIVIDAYLQDDDLVLCVSDTCKNQTKPSFRWDLAGVGLNNSRERLRQLYPDDHEINVTAEGSKFEVRIQFTAEFK